MKASVGETRLREYFAAWDTYVHDRKTFTSAGLDPYQSPLEDLLIAALCVPQTLLLGQFPDALRISMREGVIRDGKYMVTDEGTLWRVEKLKSDRPGGARIVLADSIGGIGPVLQVILQHLDVPAPVRSKPRLTVITRKDD